MSVGGRGCPVDGGMVCGCRLIRAVSIERIPGNETIVQGRARSAGKIGDDDLAVSLVGSGRVALVGSGVEGTASASDRMTGVASSARIASATSCSPHSTASAASETTRRIRIVAGSSHSPVQERKRFGTIAGKAGSAVPIP